MLVEPLQLLSSRYSLETELGTQYHQTRFRCNSFYSEFHATRDLQKACLQLIQTRIELPSKYDNVRTLANRERKAQQIDTLERRRKRRNSSSKTKQGEWRHLLVGRSSCWLALLIEAKGYETRK